MRRRILRLLVVQMLAAVIGGAPLVAARAPSPGEAGGQRALGVPATTEAGPCDTVPCYTLTFEIDGDGSGSIKTLDESGTPDGLIDCRLVQGAITADSTCSHRYVDTEFAGSVVVDWTVLPDAGNQWCADSLTSGVCGSTSPAYASNLGGDETLERWWFTPLPYVLDVSKAGTGIGTVTSAPPGIDCGATCQGPFKFGTSVTLTATPGASATFTGWTGPCSGQDATCVLTIPADTVSTTVVFTFATPTPTPTPTPQGGPVLTTSAPRPPGAKDPVILWGQEFTLTVVLGSGLANRLIELQGTRDGATWTPIQTLTTNATGRASLLYRPVTNLYYRAVAAAGGGLPEMISNQVRTTVRQLALLRPTNGSATKALARGTPITFSTTVRPSRPELALSTVTFTFTRQVAGGTVEVIRRDVTVDTAGVARTTFDFPTPGQWFVRSRANPTPYNANSLMTPIERFLVN